jgi:hypothetical protein
LNPSAQTPPPVSLWRLYALRLIYLLIFVGLSSFVWRQPFFESSGWPLMTGIAKSMFAALALLTLLGLRYPLQMLPLILFETLWKAIWLAVIALPAAHNGRWDVVEATVYECIGIVVVLFIMPWGYVWTRYVTAPGDPWR